MHWASDPTAVGTLDLALDLAFDLDPMLQFDLEDTHKQIADSAVTATSERPAVREAIPAVTS